MLYNAVYMLYRILCRPELFNNFENVTCDNRVCLCLSILFRHSFDYLVNFRSTMPSLSTALCLSQLLSTVSEKGGNPAAYREQTGQSDMWPHLNALLYYQIDCDVIG